MTPGRDEKPLTSVALVCDSHAQVTELPHVQSCVDSYVNELDSKWTLECASSLNKVRLLDLLYKTDPFSKESMQRARSARLSAALRTAVCERLLNVLAWWMTVYCQPAQRQLTNLEVFKLAVEFENLELLDWLQQRGILPEASEAIEVKCYTLEIAKWVHEHMNGVSMTLVMTVCCSIEMDYVQWAHTHQTRYNVTDMSQVVDFAAAHGKLEQLQWLHRNRPERCNSEAFRGAVQNSHIKTAKWLYEQYPKQYFDDPAGSYTKIEMAQWLLSEYEWKVCWSRDIWIDESIECLAYSGQSLNVIEFLLSIRPNANCGKAIERAAREENLKMIQVLHHHGATTTSNAMNFSAARGHLEVVQWLHANRNEGCSKKAMDDAAKNKHFDVVKWLHENRSEGCTTNAMDYAAAGGRLDTVQWLHTHRPEGCTVKAMDEAARLGHLDVVKWLHLNRFEGCTTEAMDGAVRYGDMEMIKWLHENRTEGCSPSAMNYAAANGKLELVRFLHENLMIKSCEPKAMDLAAAYGHLPVVQYLSEHRDEGCTTDAMDEAAGRGHLKVVKWLHENRPEGATSKALQRAARNGELEMVRFLVMQCKMEFTKEVIADMMSYEEYGILSWLLCHLSRSSLH